MTANEILNNIKYQEAIKRANRDEVQVIDKVFDKQHAFLGWAVKGASQPAHLVRKEGKNLICSCTAGQHGMYCKHRARVTEQMIGGDMEVVTVDPALDAWADHEEARGAALMARNDGGPRLYR